MTTDLTENMLIVLLSLKDAPKQLHLGRSPVWAITATFCLLDLHYVTADDEWVVSLTDEGRRALDEHHAKFPALLAKADTV